MDEYYKQAATYFTAFEGRQHLPRLMSWYWFVWLVTLFLLLYFIYELLTSGAQARPAFGLTFGTEVIFLSVCVAIAVYRERQISSKFDDKSIERSARRTVAKRQTLQKILGKSPHLFLEISKEIDELRTLEKAHRPKGGQNIMELWRLIYDRDAKARVLTLLTALISLAVALVMKSDGINFLEIVTDEGVRKLINSIMALAIAGFMLLVAVYIMLVHLWLTLAWAISAIHPHIQGNQTTLNYLVRDLIRFYTPQPKPATPASETSQVAHPAISTSLVIGVVSICIEGLLVMLQRRQDDCRN